MTNVLPTTGSYADIAHPPIVATERSGAPPWVRYPYLALSPEGEVAPTGDTYAGNYSGPWIQYYPQNSYLGKHSAPFYVPVNSYEFSATALVEIQSSGAISQDVTTEFEATGQVVLSTSTSLVRQRTFSGGDAVELNSQGDFEAPTDFVADALLALSTNAEFVRELSFDITAPIMLSSTSALDTTAELDPANAPLSITSTAHVESEVDFSAITGLALFTDAEIGGEVTLEASPSLPITSSASFDAVTNLAADSLVEFGSIYTVQVELQAAPELVLTSTSSMDVQVFFAASAPVVMGSSAVLAVTEELSGTGALALTSAATMDAPVELGGAVIVTLSSTGGLTDVLAGTGALALDSSAELHTGVELDPETAGLVLEATAQLLPTHSLDGRRTVVYIDALASLEVISRTIQPPDPSLPVGTPQAPVYATGPSGRRTSFVPNRVP